MAACRALLRTQGLNRAGKGGDQNWHGAGEGRNPGPGEGLDSEPCNGWLVALRAWLYSAVGLSAPPEPPERAGQAGPPHSELATVTGRILAAEQCRRDLPAQSQRFPLSLATQCHLTWNLVQELVGGARQDPDPIQLGHQVGVLIQDKSVLPAKASQEESGSGCSPTLPRASPAPAMPWNDPPEPPSPWGCGSQTPFPWRGSGAWDQPF